MRANLIVALAAAAALALAGCGGDDGDSESDSDIQAFCDKVDEIRAAEDPFAGIQGGDLEQTRAALEEAQSLFGEVADVAPAEIQADVEEAQQFFDEFVTAVNDAESPQELLSIATEFQGQAQEFQATSERLDQYTTENCGEDPSEAN